MNVIEANLDIYVGAAFVAEIQCWEDKERTKPFDFTDYDGVASLFNEFGIGETALEDFTIDFNVDRTDGIIRFTMTKVETLALSSSVGARVWDSMLGASTAQEEVFFRGNVEVHKQGSRRA